MNARNVAARFAAGTWYEEIRAGRQSRQETLEFVRGHWQAFLPVASGGLGKLLLRIARQRPRVRRQVVPISRAG
jgi:hypothetical protein